MRGNKEPRTMKAVLITSDRSGSGKTSITLALAALLKKQGNVQTFKVGMDDIDPSYLAAVSGGPWGTWTILHSVNGKSGTSLIWSGEPISHWSKGCGASMKGLRRLMIPAARPPSQNARPAGRARGLGAEHHRSAAAIVRIPGIRSRCTDRRSHPQPGQGRLTHG